MSIQGIKLVTGEELIARVELNSSDRITVNNPLVVMMSNSQHGLVVNFLPWTLIAMGDIEIMKSAVIALFDVPKEVENNYIQNTTGIQVATDAPKQILKG